MARQLSRLTFGKKTNSVYVKIRMVVDLRKMLLDKREGREGARCLVKKKNHSS